MIKPLLNGGFLTLYRERPDDVDSFGCDRLLYQLTVYRGSCSAQVELTDWEMHQVMDWFLGIKNTPFEGGK